MDTKYQTLWNDDLIDHVSHLWSLISGTCNHHLLLLRNVKEYISDIVCSAILTKREEGGFKTIDKKYGEIWKASLTHQEICSSTGRSEVNYSNA